MAGMLGPDERPEGTIRVYFPDNTYKTLPLKNDSPVEDVIQCLCKRISASGRNADPATHELFIIAPGNQSLRERRLLREDKPLQIQAKGGATAFKFLFREIFSARTDSSSGASEARRDASAACSEAPVPVADASGHIRTGQLELQEGATWHPCTVILDDEHLWYSQVRSGEENVFGGGMACLALRSCDRVLESEDKRVLQLLTKDGEMPFRAKSSNDRNSWLLAIVKQASLIKEQDILLQAERTIAAMEVRRSGVSLSRLDSLGTLEGLLSDDGEARDLFVWFLESDHGSRSAVENSSCEMAESWPAGLSPEGLLAELDRWVRAESKEPSEALTFAKKVLLPRFLSHPGIQNRLCRIAAGVT